MDRPEQAELDEERQDLLEIHALLFSPGWARIMAKLSVEAVADNDIVMKGAGSQTELDKARGRFEKFAEIKAMPDVYRQSYEDMVEAEKTEQETADEANHEPTWDRV